MSDERRGAIAKTVRAIIEAHSEWPDVDDDEVAGYVDAILPHASTESGCFWAGYGCGYHDGASGNHEDPETAWDDYDRARLIIEQGEEDG